MTNQRWLWLLTNGVIAVAIGLWLVTVYSFFIRPVVFPRVNPRPLKFLDMSGTAGFTRGFSFTGDCTTFGWAIQGAQRVLIDDAEVGFQGRKPYCFDGAEIDVKMNIWIQGIENIYHFKSQILWSGPVPMTVVGLVAMVVGLALIGIVVRAPVWFPLVARWFDRLRNIDAHRLTTIAVLWIIVVVLGHWLVRGSPGLATIANRMDDLRTFLRGIFGGPY